MTLLDAPSVSHMLDNVHCELQLVETRLISLCCTNANARMNGWLFFLGLTTSLCPSPAREEKVAIRTA